VIHLYSLGSPPVRSQDLFFSGSCARAILKTQFLVVKLLFCGTCMCECVCSASLLPIGKVDRLVQDHD
jgi:hypothetical protein